MVEMRLPWNGREGFVYGGTISLISCFLMIFFNISRNYGLSWDNLILTLEILPFSWAVVMVVMTLVAGKFADWVMERFTEPTDSFNTKILFNIIGCGLIMSIVMTIVGPTISSIIMGNPNLNAFPNWPSNWPVNFAISLWIEILIAQPFARGVMKRIHKRKIARGDAA